MHVIDLSTITPTDLRVEFTDNLSQFKYFPSNRGVDKIHVKRLRDSYRKNAIINPIYVTENNELLDGQHRVGVHLLEQAEGNPLPHGGIPYIVMKGMNYGEDTLMRFNTNKRTASPLNCVEGFAEEGNDSYATILAFQKEVFERLKTPLMVSMLLLLDNNLDISRVREGNLLVTPEMRAIAEERVQLVELFKKAEFAYYNHDKFVRALRKLFLLPCFEMSRLTRRVQKSTRVVRKWKKSAKISEYYQQIEDLYRS